MSLRRTDKLKRPSHGKLKLANSCWQTQVGVCERNKNSRQTCWQTVGVKQNLPLFSPTFHRHFGVDKLVSDVWTIGKHELVTVNQPNYALYSRDLFAWHFTKWWTPVKMNVRPHFNLSARFTIVRLCGTFHLKRTKILNINKRKWRS